MEVKGLAEREVTADLALWPLRFVASAGDLAAAQAQITRSYQEVLAFLKRQGIDASATQLQNLQVSDSNTNQYQREGVGPRFVIEQTVMVRLNKPEVVRDASQRVGELVAAGVVLSSQGGEYGAGGPTFVFSRLNELKPAMIAEATANARAAADQFARDSGSGLGGIRQANQGVFVILPRDQAPGVSESSQTAEDRPGGLDGAVLPRLIEGAQYHLHGVTGLKTLYHEFPRKFWIVVGVHFVDKVGGTLVFPFFALYITRKFNVGMTETGILLGLLALAGMVGSVIGGALTDRLGRRKLILFGLIFSALTSLAFGSVNQFAWLFPAAILVGLVSDVGGPAHGAMIADILPKEQRQEGFGILRVVGNMAWLVGPTVGGFVARTSFFALFVIDAVISCIVASLFYALMPETKPERSSGQADEGILETFRELRGRAARQGVPRLSLCGCVDGDGLHPDVQLPVGLPPRRARHSAARVRLSVVVQRHNRDWLSVLDHARHQDAAAVSDDGARDVFYMIGFGMFGIVSAYWLFVAAVVIITIGEMIVIPTSQALAASFARVDMRGRYMAAYGLCISVPAAIGPAAAGIVLDNYNPDLLWYLGALLCATAACSFYVLHIRLGSQPRFVTAGLRTEPAPLVMEAEHG